MPRVMVDCFACKAPIFTGRVMTEEQFRDRPERRQSWRLTCPSCGSLRVTVTPDEYLETAPPLR